jgi:hypothetical protein
MGAASVPVGIPAPNVLKIPLTSAVDEGEIDLTTVTGLVLTVFVPDGPNGSYSTELTWAANIAESPPYGPPTPTQAYGLYAFNGTEFVIGGQDVIGQYDIAVVFTTPGGPVPSAGNFQLEVTKRISF